MAVEIAAAGDGALAANVERGERVHLSGVGLADDHAGLLPHAGIGCGCFHAAILERRAAVFLKVREDRRSLDGFGREADRSHAAHCPRHLGQRAAVRGDEHARDAVIGPYARDIIMNHVDERGPPRPYGMVQFVDGRFVQIERRLASPLDHRVVFFFHGSSLAGFEALRFRN